MRTRSFIEQRLLLSLSAPILGCALLLGLTPCAIAGSSVPQPAKPAAGGAEWTWMGGADRADQRGVYGTLGKPAAANIPGGRRGLAQGAVQDRKSTRLNSSH